MPDTKEITRDAMMTKNHFLLKTYSPVGEITINNHTNNYIITDMESTMNERKHSIVLRIGLVGNKQDLI